MQVLDFAPGLSPDGSRIAFHLSERTGSAECAISREAFEAHLWLPPGASEVRTLKAFDDGRNRIVAVAEWNMRTRPGPPVCLTSRDSVTRG
ncbi:DUF1488 family protein [Paraburkholderia sp. RL17-381-BIF-C]|jgi:hypothetical protein|uniref:DUF1488 family protein n=1 Tax=Paraburkholderia sp. RL17-381-BIF-C TaxID=3031635 RepID=UPI0038BA74E4